MSWKTSLRNRASQSKRRILRYLSRLSTSLDPHRRQEPAIEKGLPIILISSCKAVDQKEDYRYNGGYKLYSLWVKLLRANGYPAFIVTHDGKFHPWLLEHQPHVSLEVARQWKKAGFPLRFVTGWADATAFVDLADRLYFYDCEIAFTAGRHSPVLRKLLKSKIQSIATNSRMQQAWYMATFGRPVTLIPEWSDEQYWRSESHRRIPALVGYTREGRDSEDDIADIASRCRDAGIAVKLRRISGDEQDVRDRMQECDIFLGLNPGKHPLWGEGCPRTQQEAMHAGCVVVAYDVNGNREYLIDGYSGFLAPRTRSDVLANHIIELIRNPGLKERIRETSLDLATRAFSSHGRWRLLREFLQLDQLDDDLDQNHPDTLLTKTELMARLGSPAYIGEDEIPVFAKWASSAGQTLVEIGAAYGASTVLMLKHAPRSATVYSVDPFVQDSMSAFRVHPVECLENVDRAMTSLGMRRSVSRWCLYLEASHSLIGSWDKPIDFLYIDGDHNYEAVRKDFEDWSQHVRPGGVILLHDSRRPDDAPADAFVQGYLGPTRLARELKEHRCVEPVDQAFSLTVWRKTSIPCDECIRK